MVRSFFEVSVLVVALLLARIAQAEPSEADRAQARALAAEGFRALKKQRYEVARERFSRADALVHAPTLIVDWARALAELGQLVEAQEKYELVIREGVDPKAPRAWQRALENAGVELEKLKPRLAWLTLHVNGAKEPRVTIDGIVVTASSLGVRFAVNPGTRYIRLQAPNCETMERIQAFAEGEEHTITETLTCAAAAAKAPGVASKPTFAAKPESKLAVQLSHPSAERARKHPRVLTYTALGVGGSGLVLGSVFGVLALNQRAALSDACDDNGFCSSARQSDIDRYHRFGTISVAAFAVGIAGAALGITSFALESSKAREGVGDAKLQAFVEGRSAGVKGVFQ